MKRWTAIFLLIVSVAWARPAWEAKKLSESGKATASTMAYTATIRYPNCPAGLAMARTEMASFRKNLQEVGAAPPDNPMKASLDLSYEVVFQGPSLSSLYVSGSSDFAGAHPSVLQRALLINPQGNALSAEQCFRKGGGWRKLLRDYCRARLKQRLKDGDPDWISKGTDATSENYQVVLPLAKQLRVIFTDYQVTSHAEGPQEVLVPYSVLRPEIDPKGPLAFALQ